MDDDELAVALAWEPLGDAEANLTLLSPLSSPCITPQWNEASTVDFGALGDANEAVGGSPEDATLVRELPAVEGLPCGVGDLHEASKPPGRRRRSKRPSDYNPNRARDEQRRELRELRLEVAELEAKITMFKKMGFLREGRMQGGNNAVTLNEGAAGSVRDPLAEVVWKNIAQHQFRKRLASSLKHDKLQAVVKANQRAILRMKDLLHSKSLQKAAHSLEVERSFQLSDLTELELHPILIKQLMTGVSKCYAEIDSVFRGCTVDVSQAETFSTPEMHTDSEGNLFTRVHGSKVFPFNVEKTGVAAWAQFSESIRPNARFFFTEVQQSSDDILIERFGAELHKDKSKIVIHVRQVKRRFIETDRVVVVWQSKVNPIEFEDQKLKGASFDERGYFIIHRPATLPVGYALLQSCYLISPSTPMRSMPENALARNMAEFVLSWMATTIPAIHQIVEDILIGQGQVLAAAWNYS